MTRSIADGNAPTHISRMTLRTDWPRRRAEMNVGKALSTFPTNPPSHSHCKHLDCMQQLHYCTRTEYACILPPTPHSCRSGPWNCPFRLAPVSPLTATATGYRMTSGTDGHARQDRTRPDAVSPVLPRARAQPNTATACTCRWTGGGGQACLTITHSHLPSIAHPSRASSSVGLDWIWTGCDGIPAMPCQCTWMRRNSSTRHNDGGLWCGLR